MTGRTRVASLVTLLALAFSGCSSAPPVRQIGDSGKAYADPDPVPGIRNFAWLNDRVARGSQPNEQGFQWLKAHGFRTVVSFRQHHDETGALERAGLRAVHLPVQADVWGSSPPTEEEIEVFFATVLDTTQQPVYFHCKRGADRTGLFCALYRIEVDGWTNDEAIEEMQTFGYNDFFRDLIGFARSYRPRGYASR